jgi:hypothetical protein
VEVAKNTSALRLDARRKQPLDTVEFQKPLPFPICSGHRADLSNNSRMATSHPALTRGRLCILAAAILWSLSGAFTKALTTDTFLGVNEPVIDELEFAGKSVPIQLAF